MATRRKPAGIIDDIAEPAARWAARQAVQGFIRATDNLVPKAKANIKRAKQIEGAAIKQAKGASKAAQKKASGYKKSSKSYKAITKQGERQAGALAAQKPTKTMATAQRRLQRMVDMEQAAMKHFASKQKFAQAVREERKAMGRGKK